MATKRMLLSVRSSQADTDFEIKKGEFRFLHEKKFADRDKELYPT